MVIFCLVGSFFSLCCCIFSHFVFFHAFLFCRNVRLICCRQTVGNKAKGRISKRVFQERKAHQNSRKTNISYPQIRPFALLPPNLFFSRHCFDAFFEPPQSNQSKYLIHMPQQLNGHKNCTKQKFTLIG